MRDWLISLLIGLGVAAGVSAVLLTVFLVVNADLASSGYAGMVREGAKLHCLPVALLLPVLSLAFRQVVGSRARTAACIGLLGLLYGAIASLAAAARVDSDPLHIVGIQIVVTVATLAMFLAGLPVCFAARWIGARARPVGVAHGS